MLALGMKIIKWKCIGNGKKRDSERDVLRKKMYIGKWECQLIFGQVKARKSNIIGLMECCKIWEILSFHK